MPKSTRSSNLRHGKNENTNMHRMKAEPNVKKFKVNTRTFTNLNH